MLPHQYMTHRIWLPVISETASSSEIHRRTHTLCGNSDILYLCWLGTSLLPPSLYLSLPFCPPANLLLHSPAVGRLVHLPSNQLHHPVLLPMSAAVIHRPFTHLILISSVECNKNRLLQYLPPAVRASANPWFCMCRCWPPAPSVEGATSPVLAAAIALLP